MNTDQITETVDAVDIAPATGGRLANAKRSLRQRLLRALRDDEGAATAEYAIATMAAVGFATVLVIIMQSDEVQGILEDLVRRALTVNV